MAELCTCHILWYEWVLWFICENSKIMTSLSKQFCIAILRCGLAYSLESNRDSEGCVCATGVVLAWSHKKYQLEICMCEIRLYVIFILHIHTWYMSLIVMILWPLFGLVTNKCDESRFDHILVWLMAKLFCDFQSWDDILCAH